MTSDPPVMTRLVVWMEFSDGRVAVCEVPHPVRPLLTLDLAPRLPDLSFDPAVALAIPPARRFRLECEAAPGGQVTWRE